MDYYAALIDKIMRRERGDPDLQPMPFDFVDTNGGRGKASEMKIIDLGPGDHAFELTELERARYRDCCHFEASDWLPPPQDIVERLRDAPSTAVSMLMQDAAEEIERLRAEVSGCASRRSSDGGIAAAC